MDDPDRTGCEILDLLKKANAAYGRKRFDEAEHLYRQVLERASRDDARNKEKLFSLMRLADLYANRGRMELALQCLDEASEAAQRAGFVPGILECTQRISQILMNTGKWELARRKAEAGRRIAAAEGEEGFESVFVGLLGQLARRQGRNEEALALAMDGLELARRSGHLGEELAFLNDMINISLASGDYDTALRQACAGYRRAEETASGRKKTVFLGQRCRALIGLDRLDEARKVALEGLDTANEFGDPVEAATFHHDLFLLAMKSEDFDEAERRALAAYRIFLEQGHKEGVIASLRYLAAVFAEKSDWEAAYKAIIDAMVIAVSVDRRIFFSVFLEIFPVSLRLARAREFRDVDKGISLVRDFLSSIDCQLSSMETERSGLSVLASTLDCLALIAESNGAESSESAGKARRLAREIDRTTNWNISSLVGQFFR